MSITSFQFFFFLFIILVFYYAVFSVSWKKCVLLTANLLFYASFDPSSLIYLGSIVIFVYLAGLALEKWRRKWVLALSLLPVLAGLCTYKYSGFLLMQIQPLIHVELPVCQFIVPLGISFFTFKSLGYLIDVYRTDIPAEKNLLNCALYLTFFPQISSGPIQKANEFLSQVHENRTFKADVTQHGIILVIMGIFEKMVIADRLYLVVSACFKQMTPSSVLIGTLAYTFQIYADFDSYSNIAIGLGELFGYQSKKNFNVPYLSKDLQEFWTRWHMSLSTWLKDYLYIPLGGNRKGLFRKYVNLMIVFLVSGLWHGAAWNFVLWGAMNGLVQIVYDLLFRKLFKKLSSAPQVIRFCVNVLRIGVNFAVVNVLWIFFRCQSVDEIMQVFTLLGHVDFPQFSFVIEGISQPELAATFIFVVLLVAVDVLRYAGFSCRTLMKVPFPLRLVLYGMMIVLLLVFGVYGPGYDASKFIYLEF